VLSEDLFRASLAPLYEVLLALHPENAHTK
jgi:hypothetical protein